MTEEAERGACESGSVTDQQSDSLADTGATCGL